MKVPYGLPLDFHDDGTPIFNRGDFIRDPIPMNGANYPVLYQNLILPEHRALNPSIQFNLHVLPPATDQPTTSLLSGITEYGRIIQALDPNCTVAIQKRTSKTKVQRFYLYHLKPLQFCVVPPRYDTQLINNSSEKPAKFFELKAKEDTRNIEDLLELNGLGYTMTMTATLEPNKNYDELPIPEIRPGLEQFKILIPRPLYTIYTLNPQAFSFIDPPNHAFFSGAV